jgi:peroxiredoxin-like protein
MEAIMEPIYRYATKAQWTTERRGQLSADGMKNLEFSAPPEFQGQTGIWTPEHLLLGSVIACFVTTFRAIAENSRFAFRSLEVEAAGGLEKDESGLRFGEILLRPVLTVDREPDRERGLRLLHKAERHCIISRSLRNRVNLSPAVVVEAEPALPSGDPLALPVKEPVAHAD